MSIINIVADDNRVTIDSESETVTFTGNPNIHAIHWDTVSLTGEVEFKNKANEVIDDFAPYQHFIGDHGVSKVARLQKDIDDAAIGFAALTPQQKRDGEYPSIEAQFSAMHHARGGDSSPLVAIDAAMDIIDAKYPL